MSDAAPAQATYSVVGDRYTLLVIGAQTAGAYAVIEMHVPAGNGSPPHLHRREDEAFYIVEGEFEFTVQGQPSRLRAGEFLFGHRGIAHNFKNVGSTPGTMIVTVTPAGLENYFAEIGTLLPSRDSEPIPSSQEDIGRLIEAAPRYGLELLV